MPSEIRLTTIAENRGTLTVVEKGVPFPVKRIFYTYNVPPGTVRGGHGHKRTRIALVAAAGVCVVSGFSLTGEAWTYRLDDPSRCLVLEPGDWHRMAFEKAGTVLICFASEEYDPDDYVYDQPKK
jgi:hypothetical protein